MGAKYEVNVFEKTPNGKYEQDWITYYYGDWLVIAIWRFIKYKSKNNTRIRFKNSRRNR